ncbi:unnamed protein product (macronuclear) [Paramecium tetraurelia]|uniref:DRBM domain-containing protein n=1 Tax=Paramecium tetraurelia TaxID=5888 RepID=A0C2A7_PARTE|nr:uncharacterized protein GSPATT00034401001 [Paramecium tetraurelia]CAK64924.1 unnamed protein product [Paramecium tetraurelia]|eukprot:XP_001432321.1 hypothetical protein (macronuclear) [Paramecium tetraurelia strain d4-2]
MKVKQIKEILDQLKEKYKMEMKYNKIQENFRCEFYINCLKIAEGQGVSKKYAKNDAASKAYDILVNSDYSFARRTGMKIQDEDYKQQLEQYALKKNIRVEFKEGVKNELGYSQYYIQYGSRTFIGYGLKTKKCFNFMSHCILKKLEYNEKMDQLKNQKEPEKQAELQEHISPRRIKIVRQTTVPMQQNQQIKIEDSEPPPQESNLIKELKIYHFLNSLMITEDVYNYFDMFLLQMSYQNDFRFRTVGAFTTKSIRTLKPELDILINIPKGNFPQFEQFLERTSKQFQYKVFRNKKHIQIELPFQTKSKFLRWTISSIKVNMYIKKKLAPDSLIHDEYMKQYQVQYLQNRYSTQYLSLIHQWKEDSKIPLNTNILDYLVVQVSNYFQTKNHPIVILKQLIFLLKNGVLDDILDFEKGEIELNPFLQAIPDYQIFYIKKIAEQTRKQIKEIAEYYDEKKIQTWISNYID